MFVSRKLVPSFLIARPLHPSRLLRPRVLLVAALLLSACAADDALDEPAVEPLAEEQAALGESTCTGAELNFTAGVPESQRVCAGPWRYKTQSFVANDPGCVDQFCPNGSDELMCPSWTATPLPPPVQSSYSAQETFLCEEMGHPAPGAPQCVELPVDQADVWCSGYKQNKLNAAKAGVPANLASQVKIVQQSMTGARVPGTWSWKFTCKVTIQRPVPKQVACPCSVPKQYVSCWKPSATWFYSTSVGQPRDAAIGSSAAKADLAYTPLENDAPQCTSCEHLPNPGPLDSESVKAQKAQDKFACIQGNSALVPSAYQRAPLDKAKKLIYEMWGEYLQKGQRAAARAAYGYDLDNHHACGLTIEQPTVPSTCSDPALAARRGELIRCQRLLAGPTHTSIVNASIELPGCIELLDAYADLDATPHEAACEGETGRDIARRTLVRLFDKSLGVITSAPSTLGALPRQLYLFDQWYEQAERVEALRPDGDGSELDRDLSRLLGRFWLEKQDLANIYDVLVGLPANASLAAVEAAIGTTGVAARQLDQQIVTTLFSVPGTFVLEPDATAPINVTLTRPPLRGVPLVALLGDALTPLVQDLQGLSVYHDVGCQFRDCRAPIVDTPSRRLWRFLASFENPTVLTAAATTSQPLGGWAAPFQLLAGRQAFLAQALDAAVEGGAAFQSADLASVRPSGRQLWKLVNEAAAAHARYEATGQFQAGSIDVMYSSILESERSNVLLGLRERVAQLDAAVAAFRGNLKSFISAQLEVMATGTSIERMLVERLQIARQADQKLKKIFGLQKSGESEVEEFGSLCNAFADVQPQVDQGAFFAVGNTETFSLSGRDARFTTSAAPLNVNVGPVFPDLHEGEMLLVQSTGHWSPTCALTDQKFLTPTGLPGATTSASGAYIGPEGFSIQWNGSQYLADSYSAVEDESTTVGVSARVCAKAEYPIKAVASVSVETCAYTDYHQTDSEIWNDSNGRNHETSASFNGGLRLEQTPFPDLPAGALLVVLADAATQEIHDIHVVQSGGTSILIEEPTTTAYFVINDLHCGGPVPADDPKLTITARKLVSAQAATDQLLIAMGEVLEFFDAKQDELVAQGTLLPNQAALLRGQARAKLRTMLGPIALEQYPLPLLELFDNFVDHRLVMVERRIEIEALEDAFDLDVLSLRIIDDELRAGATRARLQTLLPRWILRDLDGVRLRREMTEMLVVTRDYLRPIIDLWYPHALDGLAFGAQTDPLLYADVDASLVELADNAADFVDQILDAYQVAQFGYKPPAAQLPVVAVAFPRPGVVVEGSPWRLADPARSADVWAAIEEHGSATVALSPEDVYSKNLGSGVLSCYESVPVVKSFGIFAVRPQAGDNQTLNGLNRRVQAYGSVTQPFATLQGPRTYQIGNGTWQHFESTLRYGETEQALTDFAAAPKNTRPVGLSPFGTVELDFSVLDGMPASGFAADDPFQATQVILLLELDSRAVATRPDWVTRCQ